MTIELKLGVRLPSSPTLTVYNLNDINLKNKVDELKNETAKKVNLAKDKFELVYCGCLLEDDTTLESCGLKSGVMVHVLQKKDPEPPVEKKIVSDITIQRLASVFSTFNENPALRSAFYRLSKRSDIIENIIASSPLLSEDSVAIAMLQDPILMLHFSDADTIKRIAEQHPVLITVAQQVAAAVHEEAHDNAASTSGSSMNLQDTSFPFSLDNFSDVEEMAADSSQSSDSTQQSNSSGITTAQLAAALSRASARSFPLSGSSSSTSRGNSNSGLITTEMFSQAMQQAFASTQPSTGSPTVSPVVPQVTDMQRQLALMHEMGLQDDTVNIQALQFTNGDVQAAIELVFGGFNDN